MENKKDDKVTSSPEQNSSQEETYNLIIKEYHSFKDRLSEEIINNEFCYNVNNKCYLILVSCINELNNNINEYYDKNLYIKKNLNDSFIFGRNKHPKSIDNIKDAIDCIKKNGKLEIINQDLFNFIFKDCNLKEINYFCGNNRLIIEFEEEHFYSLIFIINPQKSFSNSFEFKIEKKNRNKIIELYKNLLFIDKDITNFMIDLKTNDEIAYFKKIIDNFDVLFNKINNEIECNHFNLTEFKFIYFFCYKKFFSLFKLNIFKSYQNYYLINSEFLSDFKKNSIYEEINNLLKKYDYFDKNLNIDNFEEYMYNIINYYLDKKNFNYKNEKLTNINNIFPKKINKFDIELYDNCSFVHEIFIKIINKYGNFNKKLSIKPKNIIIKNGIIYLFEGNYITIGNINEQLLFIPKYICFYSDLGTLEEEKKLLISNKIKEYIISRKCNINNHNNQTLIKGNNKIIGKLLILHNDIQLEEQNNINIIKYNNSFINNDFERENELLEIYNKKKEKEIDIHNVNLLNKTNEKNDDLKKMNENIQLKDEEEKLKNYYENEKNEKDLNNSIIKEKQIEAKKLQPENEIKEENYDNKLRSKSKNCEQKIIKENERQLRHKGSYIKDINKIYNKNKPELTNIEKEIIKLNNDEKDNNNQLLEKYQKEIEELRQNNIDKDEVKNKLISFINNKEEQKENDYNKFLEENQKLKEYKLNFKKELDNESKLNEENKKLKQNKDVYQKNLDYKIKDITNKNENILMEEDLNKKNLNFSKKYKKRKIKKQKNNDEQLNKEIKKEKDNKKVKQKDDFIININEYFQKQVNIQPIKNNLLLSFNNDIDKINENYNKLLNKKLKKISNDKRSFSRIKENLIEEKVLNKYYKSDKNNEISNKEEYFQKLNKKLNKTVDNKEKIIKIEIIENNNKDNEEKLKKEYENKILNKNDEIQQIKKNNNNINEDLKIKEKEYNIKISLLEEQKNNFQNENKELIQANKNLENEVKEFEQNNKKLNDNIENLKRELNDKMEENKQLYKRIYDKSIKNRYNLKNRKLLMDNNKEDEELKIDCIYMKEDQLEEKKKLNDKFKLCKSNDKNKLKEFQSLNERLKEYNFEKNEEIKILKENNKKNEEKLKKEFEIKLQEKEDEIKKELEKKEKEINNIINENEELKNKLSNNQKKLENLEKEINELKQINKNKENEINKLNEFKKQIEEKEKQNQKLLNEIIELKQNNKKIKKEFDDKKNENEKLIKESEIFRQNEKNYKNKINEIESENKKIKEENDKLKSEIKELKKELEINKQIKNNNINNLEKLIEKYKYEKDELLNIQKELKKENEILKINKNDLQKQINDDLNIINDEKQKNQSLQDRINQKDNEIKKLKEELADKVLALNSHNQLIMKNQMMSINFISTDSYLHYSIPCLSTDIFAEIEEKLYKEYPEYRETDNYFLYNGNKIFRFKTIEQNNIKNGKPITLITP